MHVLKEIFERDLANLLKVNVCGIESVKFDYSSKDHWIFYGKEFKGRIVPNFIKFRNLKDQVIDYLIDRFREKTKIRPAILYVGNLVIGTDFYSVGLTLKYL
jgi:hypothetical protein